MSAIDSSMLNETVPADISVPVWGPGQEWLRDLYAKQQEAYVCSSHEPELFVSEGDGGDCFGDALGYGSYGLPSHYDR